MPSLHLDSHLLDRRDCSILPHRKDLHIENFIEDTSVVVDVVVVDMMEVVEVVAAVVDVVVVVVEVELIDYHVRFSTYRRLDFYHQS